MSGKNPDTFLSRVFGTNSNYQHGDTELSGISNDYLSEVREEERSSLIHSEADESGSESETESGSASEEHGSDYESDKRKKQQHESSRLFTNDTVRRVQLGHDEEEDDEDEDNVPISLLVQEKPNNRQSNTPGSSKSPPSTSPPPPQSTALNTFNNIKSNIGKNLPKQLQNMGNAFNLTNNNNNEGQQEFDIEAQQPVSYKKPSQTPQTASAIEQERNRRARLGILSPRERALWKWANIENLDKFLQDVYSYYLGNGFYCILLSKVLDLATLVFVVYFSTYLTACIDYSKLSLPTSKSLSDITVDQCYSKISSPIKFMLWMIYCYFALKIVQFYFDAKELREIYYFYNYLLDVSDTDLQTISWQVVVQKLMQLKDQNAMTSNVSDLNKQKLKPKIDAHTIANRIMRKENYLIALFNKDILDLTLPVPGYTENVLTKTLEWNLSLCIIGFVFNEHGQIRQQFLKENKRRQLADELKKRFILAGIFNIILAPFIVTYFILLYFFRYFNEYQKNPGSIGMRQYTPLAEWKFREYNELYHLFQKRLNLSVPEASKYIDQFPKEKTVIVLKFVSFISGSFAAVLGILSIVDPDMFFNFEITKDRTVLFYISIFGTIWAICHNAIPEEYQVFDPEESLKKVAEYTHYMPPHWEEKYHADETRIEFGKLFEMKAVLLMRELASLIMTPFILWFSLPRSTNKIIDFFREFTVHVDGLGYVCTFAMFNFEKGKKLKTKYNRSSEDKMMKSYLYFLDSYGDNSNDLPKNGVKKMNKLSKPKSTSPLQHSMYVNDVRRERHNPINMNSSYYGQLNDQQYLKRNNNSNQLKNSFSGLTSQNLGESFITTMPNTDVLDEYHLGDGGDGKNDDEDNHSGKSPGVLGLLNQFYKDYEISK